jgi:hypothetical protein
VKLAAFWFGVLNKFIVVRSTVKRQEMSPPEPSNGRRNKHYWIEKPLRRIEMQIRDNHPLKLTGDDQEQITIRVASKKPGDTVAYALDGVKGGALPNPFTFRLNKGAHNPSVLTLVFNFVGSGGEFEMTVTGSNPGATSVYTQEQLQGVLGEISYTIRVV